MLPNIEGDFRAVADPVLKFSPSGKAYCQVRGVADKKKKNEATGEWEDDKVLWVNITGFGKTAEGMADSITKGVLMSVAGTISTREYDKQDGTKGFSVDIAANRVGVSLAYDSATVRKVERNGGQQQAAAQPAAAANPWATGAAPADQGEPPF